MICLSTPVKVETITTGETHGADVALMDRVKLKVRLEGTNRDGQCIILFCPITSRVGSDVEAAMRNVPPNRRIILVLMHHTRDVDYSTGGNRWSEEYPNIDLEVHVLFHESVPGLLTCYKNTEAVYEMQEYFKRNARNPRFKYLFAFVFGALVVVGSCLGIMVYFLEKEEHRNISNGNVSYSLIL